MWRALIVAAFAVLASVTSAGERCERVYHAMRTVVADTVLTFPVPQGVCESTLEVRMAPVDEKERPGMSRQAWGLSWSDGLAVEVRNGNSAYGDAADTRFTRVTVCYADSVLMNLACTQGFATGRNLANSLIVTRNYCTGAVSLSGGASTPQLLGEFTLPPAAGAGDSVAVFAQGRINLLMAVSEWSPDVTSDLTTEWTSQALRERFLESTDPLEGFWTFFDQDSDAVYARPGGRYTLATVGDGSGRYTIIYISGAETLADQWHEGMVKGVLQPTVFIDQFDLEWVDSEFTTLSRDIHARIENNALLVVEFPLLKMQMRFVRQPLVKNF